MFSKNKIDCLWFLQMHQKLNYSGATTAASKPQLSAFHRAGPELPWLRVLLLVPAGGHEDLKGARSAMHPEFVTSQCVLARLCLTPLLGAVFKVMPLWAIETCRRNAIFTQKTFRLAPKKRRQEQRSLLRRWSGQTLSGCAAPTAAAEAAATGSARTIANGRCIFSKCLQSPSGFSVQVNSHELAASSVDVASQQHRKERTVVSSFTMFAFGGIDDVWTFGNLYHMSWTLHASHVDRTSRGVLRDRPAMALPLQSLRA